MYQILLCYVLVHCGLYLRLEGATTDVKDFKFSSPTTPPRPSPPPRALHPLNQASMLLGPNRQMLLIEASRETIWSLKNVEALTATKLISDQNSVRPPALLSNAV